MQKGVPLFLGLFLLVISPLSAQVEVDVAKIDCHQFATYKVANPDRIAIWLDGYFHGKRGDLTSTLGNSPQTQIKSKHTASKIPTYY